MGASHDANGDLVGYDAAMAFTKNPPNGSYPVRTLE